MLLFVPILKDLGAGPLGRVLVRNWTMVNMSFLSQLLGPLAAEKGLCGSEPCVEGRSVTQLCPRRQHWPQRWVLGSAHPASRPGRGGAGRRPPPAVPFSLPLPSSARATAACEKLVAGHGAGARAGPGRTARTAAGPDSESVAGGAERVGRGIRTALLGSPGARARKAECQDRDVG